VPRRPLYRRDLEKSGSSSDILKPTRMTESTRKRFLTSLRYPSINRCLVYRECIRVPTRRLNPAGFLSMKRTDYPGNV